MKPLIVGASSFSWVAQPGVFGAFQLLCCVSGDDTRGVELGFRRASLPLSPSAEFRLALLLSANSLEKCMNVDLFINTLFALAYPWKVTIFCSQQKEDEKKMENRKSQQLHPS